MLECWSRQLVFKVFTFGFRASLEEVIFGCKVLNAFWSELTKERQKYFERKFVRWQSNSNFDSRFEEKNRWTGLKTFSWSQSFKDLLLVSVNLLLIYYQWHPVKIDHMEGKEYFNFRTALLSRLMERLNEF